MQKFVCVAAVLAACGVSVGAIRINEIHIDTPGTDNGAEGVELFGTPGMSLSNHWLLVIEGDSTAAGVVDQAINLGAMTNNTVGSNGLWLQRDGSVTLDTSLAAGLQGPSAGTTVQVTDFAPDIENGTNTYLLVTGFTGAVTNDLDTNNDGVLDNMPWASVLDGVSVRDTNGIMYAASLGFVNFSAEFGSDQGPRAIAFGADGQWYGMDYSNDLTLNPNLTDVAATRIMNTAGVLTTIPTVEALTLGAANTIPTPGALTLVGAGLLLAGRRRR